MNLSKRRIWGIVLRHLYNFRRSLDRLTDAFYWPSLDIVIWGLAFSTMEGSGGVDQFKVPMILFAAILWYIVWRGQGEITIGLLEEIWSENISNLFATPLSIAEWMIAVGILGLMKLTMTVIFTSAVAYILYSISFLSLGLSIVPFITSLLVTGWAFGFLMSGLFLRFGTDIQTLAWAGSFMLMPFSAVYYTLESLPNWVQFVANWLPTTYIFEAMRYYVINQIIAWDMIGKSFALNFVCLVLAVVFFFRSFKKAKENGLAQLQ